jgi:drug/metabolite transporter (DMT)-like permease
VLSLVLAFGSGMGWGTADFLGGLSARRLPVLTVSLVSQVAGFLFLAVIIAIRGEWPRDSASLLYGLAAGAFGVIGLAALYRGLAVGRMSVVAPTAALSGTVPVAVGLLRGEQPSAVQLVGVGLAIAGVVLAARTPDEEGGTRMAEGIGLALLAAATLGGLVVLLDEIGRADPVWGTLMLRVSAIALLLVVVAVRRPSFGMSGRDARRLGAVGVLDNASNLSFAIAADTGGLLTLTAVLGSLYPVATVVLARVVLHERLARHQLVGVVAALIGVALIAAG